MTTKLEMLENEYKRAEAKWYDALGLTLYAYDATGSLFSNESNVADIAMKVMENAYAELESELKKVEGMTKLEMLKNEWKIAVAFAADAEANYNAATKTAAAADVA